MHILNSLRNKRLPWQHSLAIFAKNRISIDLSISNDIVSTKIDDKRDHFEFEIVNIPFSDGDVPCSTSYISQLIRFARASSYVTDFNTRN